MKQKIVPNIFALTKEEFRKKLELLNFSKEIHLDFMDGKFTKNPSLSINEMRDIRKFPDKKYNIHLMAQNPISYLSKIKKLAIEKVYLQFEVYSSDFKILYDINILKENNLKIGLVLNPTTPPEAIKPFFEKIDSVMLMSVEPGEEGQKFIEEVLPKIRRLKQLGFRGEIAIDGGINANNASKIIEHGANTLYIGSYISGGDDAEEKYNNLMQTIK